MFLPTTREEMDALGWSQLDVILITGDAYVDSPFIGVAVIGHVLRQAGYRVGVIGQPDIHSARDITRLGEPTLFWGVTGGCIDSMIANYTATGKPKRHDDMTPGGRNDRRPDRAVIVYTNLIKRHFKGTVPIVLGGIEASLRRVAHYDFWDDRIRRSILFDAKADILVYGMAERTIVALAERLRTGGGPDALRDLRGICYIAPTGRPDYIELPPYKQVAADPQAFTEMFHTFYRHTDPLTAQGLYQRQDTRYLIQNPPATYLTTDELDAVYALDYERAAHPFYARQGEIRALETIRFSITSHRGCYGECNFCAITVHQGRTVRWRSIASIVREVEHIARQPHSGFRGVIQDVGGPTANMYGFECHRKLERGACPHRRCLYPQVCPQLKVNHRQQIALLRRLRKVEGVRHVFVASGVRYDLVLADRGHGEAYLRVLVAHHISGQMKVAPEHSEPHVLARMGKPDVSVLRAFKRRFERLTRAMGKRQFLTYYLIAAHPGCTAQDMVRLRRWIGRQLHIRPEQVQIFTPTPSTYSTLMYYTERDPFTGEPVFVEKDTRRRARQKEIVIRGGAHHRTRGKGRN